jgi:hypothetical protein
LCDLCCYCCWFALSCDQFRKKTCFFHSLISSLHSSGLGPLLPEGLHPHCQGSVAVIQHLSVRGGRRRHRVLQKHQINNALTFDVICWYVFEWYRKLDDGMWCVGWKGLCSQVNCSKSVVCHLCGWFVCSDSVLVFHWVACIDWMTWILSGEWVTWSEDMGGFLKRRKHNQNSDQLFVLHVHSVDQQIWNELKLKKINFIKITL